jgi:hypothetical protein
MFVEDDDAVKIDIVKRKDGNFHCPCGGYIATSKASGDGAFSKLSKNMRKHAKSCNTGYMILKEISLHDSVLTVSDDLDPCPPCFKSNTYYNQNLKLCVVPIGSDLLDDEPLLKESRIMINKKFGLRILCETLGIIMLELGVLGFPQTIFKLLDCGQHRFLFLTKQLAGLTVSASPH